MDNCSRCKAYLWTEIEQDTGLCSRCADRLYEQSQARREFAYYHPPLTEDEKDDS